MNTRNECTLGWAQKRDEHQDVVNLVVDLRIGCEKKGVHYMDPVLVPSVQFSHTWGPKNGTHFGTASADYSLFVRVKSIWQWAIF